MTSASRPLPAAGPLPRALLETSLRPRDAVAPPVQWTVSERLVPYEEAMAAMEARAAAIADGTADECVWLLEHPPL